MTNDYSKVKIGISVALPQELRSLTKKRIPYGSCLALNEHLFVVLSGMGEKAASDGGLVLVEKGADALISWGSAAALHPQLRPGSFIIPEKILTEDGGVFFADANLRNRILQLIDPGSKVFSEPLYGSPSLLSSPNEKKALFQKTGAIAADMESTGLAKIAADFRLPFVALRAISDSAQMHLPTAIANSFNSQGELGLLKLTIQLILHPAEWRAVFQLANGFKKASNSLSCLAKNLRNQVETSAYF